MTPLTTTNPVRSLILTAIDEVLAVREGDEIVSTSRALDDLLDIRSAAQEDSAALTAIDGVLAQVAGRTALLGQWYREMLTELRRLLAA